MTSAFEQSFKKRLSLIAKERNLTPAEVWHNVITERFLIRLCRSSYRDHFIFKGGTLLARHINLGRETRDLDFSIQNFSNEIPVLQKAFIEIVQMPIEDGFVFENPTLVPLEHFHMQYPGAQVKIGVRFGKSRFPLFIDLGFGDLVYPQTKEIRLLANASGPLFEPSVTLYCYPPEFTFAEKLETVVYRGGENSRMKDFHDLHSLVNARLLKREAAMQATEAVFKHRKTTLRLPIQFNESEISSLQGYWERYLLSIAGLPNKLPVQIIEILNAVNVFITATSL